MPWTFPFLGETEELNEATRSKVAGSFVQLTNGCTHYELGGERSGQPVVLVHGFSVPYFIWDPTFEFLTKSGFCVLRYDLFGRGYSDRPQARYDIDTFCGQLRELLDTLGFERVILIGLSLGGPISATFTTRYPERIQKLVLIDPAGARSVVLLKSAVAEIMPGISGLLPGQLRSGPRTKEFESDFYDPENLKAFTEKYMVQLKYKGFTRAILATIRHGMLGDFSDTYRQIGHGGTPVMLLWGRDDKTVPFAQSDIIREAIPQVEFHAFEHCGHIPHCEKPEEVNPLLLEFLK
jgi:pimeloyl-ACP methyl ester carboxylesterase